MLNNTFTDEFGIPDLNLPPIIIDDIPLLHKIAHYTKYLLPDTISIAYGNYGSTLTTTSNFPDLLPYDDHNTLYIMKKYVPFLCRVKRGYCCRKHDKKDATTI